jgi:hypothetical protein
MIVYVLFVHKKICFKEKRLYYFHKKFKIKKKPQTPPKKTFCVFSVFWGGFFWVVFFWVGFLLPTLSTGRGAQQQQRGATAGDGGLQQRGQRYCGQPGSGATTATAVATTPAAYTHPRSVRCGTSIVADPGSDFFPSGSRIRAVSIPDPGSASKNLSILKPKKPKKLVLSARKYDLVVHPVCQILDPDADFLPIPDPGSRGQKGTGSRVRIRNTGYQYSANISVVDPDPDS